MDSEGTKRIRIAVAVTLEGKWAACSSSAAEGVSDDEIDHVNSWKAAMELRALGVESLVFRIVLVEATVILPILEKQEVVVQADKVI